MAPARSDSGTIRRPPSPALPLTSAPASPSPDVPEGFHPRRFGDGFIGVNGPLYVRRIDSALQLGFRVERRHCNMMGICHGGMMATFCDMLLPISAHVLSTEIGNRFLPTISLQIDYLAASPLGAWVQGECSCCAPRESSRLHARARAEGRRQHRARERHPQIGPPFEDAAVVELPDSHERRSRVGLDLLRGAANLRQLPSRIARASDECRLEQLD